MPGRSGLISGSANRESKVRDGPRRRFVPSSSSERVCRGSGLRHRWLNRDDLPICHAFEPETALIPSGVQEHGRGSSGA